MPSSASVPRTGQAVSAVTSATGILVAVTATITPGPASFRITGVPADGTREARDRIRAATVNSGLPWPGQAITISVQPSALPRYEPGLDLAIALAILTASPAGGPACPGCVCIAELGLDGALRPVPGVRPAVIAAAAASHAHVMTAGASGALAGGLHEAILVPLQSLLDAVTWLRAQPRAGAAGPHPPGSSAPAPGLGGLAVPPAVRLALEASAAGGHHLALTCSPGSGAADLAAGVAGLMPDLSPAEALEVSAIHSAAGLPGPGRSLSTRPPLQAPEHTATAALIAGGGRTLARPGAASLAHRGVLFLQDAPEFAAQPLALLRQPLRDGVITITRSGRTVTFPARLTLVAGMRPCPCGHHPCCACTPLAVSRYHRRVMDRLGQHIPLRLDLTPTAGPGLPPPEDDTADLTSAARVAAARDRARARLAGAGCDRNADMPPAALQRSCRPAPAAAIAARRAVDLGQVSVPGAAQVLRVAWTLADLAGKDQPGAAEAAQALAFWTGGAR